MRGMGKRRFDGGFAAKTLTRESHAQKQFHQLSRLGIESFRFEEQNECEYEI